MRSTIEKALTVQHAVDHDTSYKLQERDGLTLAIQDTPKLIYNSAGNPVAVDAYLRMFINGDEAKVDPHRIITNPRVKGEQTVQSFWDAVWESVLSTPNPEGFGTRGTVTTVFGEELDPSNWARAGDTSSKARNGGVGTEEFFYNDPDEGPDDALEAGFTNLDGSYFWVQGRMQFDTSTLPDDDVISAATLSLWGMQLKYGGTLQFINIYSGHYQVDDNDLWSRVHLARLPAADWDTGQYLAFTSLEDFKFNISHTTLTSMVMAGSVGSGFILAVCQRAVGNAQDPKLVITHAARPPRTFAGI